MNQRALRCLVCGGRNFGEMPKHVVRGTPSWYTSARAVEREQALFRDQMAGLLFRPSVIIHGAARRGADRLAAAWAKREGIPDEPYPADWYPEGFGKLDRSAGPKRNQRMIDEGKPDLVIAFPGGKGTADMVSRARKAGIEVIEIPPSPHQGER